MPAGASITVPIAQAIRLREGSAKEPARRSLDFKDYKKAEHHINSKTRREPKASAESAAISRMAELEKELAELKVALLGSKKEQPKEERA